MKLLSRLRFSMPPARPLALSALMAAVLLVLTFLAMNTRWSVSGEKMTLKYYELLRAVVCGEREPVSMEDSVLLIDVHYDKRMVMERDADTGDPKGMVPVVDRSKLLRLLQQLDKTRDYRYILIDVAFDAEVPQPEDDALFQLIARMPRITVAMPFDRQPADSILLPKMGCAQYGTSIWENDFVKYPYLTEGAKSMPLKMYEELTGRTVADHGWFCTEGWALARRSVIQTFELQVVKLEELRDSDLQPVNVPTDLGTGILGDPLGGESFGAIFDDDAHWADGKYLLIGDYEDDLHTTYNNDDVAGTVINFNAYLSLLRGHHRVSLLFLLVLFALYWWLMYLVVADRSVTFKRIMGFSSLTMSAWCLLSYWLTDEVYDVLLAVTLTGIAKWLFDTVAYVRERWPKFRKKLLTIKK